MSIDSIIPPTSSTPSKRRTTNAVSPQKPSIFASSLTDARVVRPLFLPPSIIIRVSRPFTRAHSNRRSDPAQSLLDRANTSPTPPQSPRKYIPYNSPRKPSRLSCNKRLWHPSCLRINSGHSASRLGYPIMCLPRRASSWNGQGRYSLDRIFPSATAPLGVRHSFPVRNRGYDRRHLR